MKTGLIAVGIATMALTFSTDGWAQAEDLFVHIKSAKDKDKLNPYYGGIPGFQLDKKNAALIGDLFPHGVATKDGGLYVLRDQDPDHIKCMSENGLAPLLQIRDHMKDPLAAIVGDFEIEPIVGCNERWHRKIVDALTKKDAKIEELKLEARDQNMRDQVIQIVNLLKGVKVDIEDPEGPIGALKSQMNSIAASNTELINILKTQQDAADKADKIREQKAKIEAGAQFTDMLGKIVFAKNPEAAYKVSVATKGLSSIAQNIIDIRNTEKIGQKLLSGLSATNAALSMISMFSAFGEDPTASMIKQGFESLHNDIQNLAETMNNRFDRVEAGMQLIYNNMNSRFDRLDVELATLGSLLGKLDDRVKHDHKITEEALAALLSHPVKKAYAICAEKYADQVISFDALRDCQGEFASFGIFGAVDASLNGEAFFDVALAPEVSANLLDGIDLQNQLGYLRSSLVDGLGNPGAGSAVLTKKTASPFIWANTIDAYLLLFDLAPKLVRDPIKSEALINASQGQIAGLIGSGESILASERALRTEGVDIAVAIYRLRLAEVSNSLSAFLYSQALDRDLGITKEDDYRTVEAGFPDDPNHITISMRRGTGIYMIEGPQKGTPIVWKRYQMRKIPQIDISGGNAPAVIAYYINLAETDWILNDEPLQFGLTTYEPPVDNSADEIKAKLRSANEQFGGTLKVAEMSNAPAMELDRLPAWIAPPPRDVQLAQACVNLASARLYVMRLALFGRAVDGENDNWAEALAQLPGGQASEGHECDELVSFLKQTGIPAGLRKDKLLRDYYNDWIMASAGAKVDAFVEAYKIANQNVADPMVEVRLQALKNMVRPDMQAAAP